MAILELEQNINDVKQREIESTVKLKVNAFKDFLTNFKKNDLINNNWLYYLTNYSKYELGRLNETLQLKNYQKDGKDLFQLLLAQSNHSNLVQFLLKARQLEIYINSSGPDTTLTTILQSNHIYKHDLAKSLFLRNYKLTKSDIDFIKQMEKGFESDRQIKKYEYYEQVQTEGAIDLVADNLNELLVIECAKQGKIELLGNGSQGPVWLANLAITQYAKYWPMFDTAFKKYDFYTKILSHDVKGTFKKKQLEIKSRDLESYPFFEALVKTLFPELKEDMNYPVVII